MRRAIAAFLVWAVSMALIVALFTAVAAAYRYWQMPLVKEATTIQVEPGQSMQTVAANLHELRPAIPARIIYWTARFRGQARQIQAGEYEIRVGERLPALLDRMVTGDVIEYRLTIPEGVTAAAFLAQLADAPRIRHTLDPLTPEAVTEATYPF